MVFFFKQKPAYEMRISDWSSDVCSSDLTFLAAAGLERLGETGVGTPLDTEQWLPAAAQGAIGIECLAENARVLELLAAINDPPSMAEVRADRALLAELGGTCHSPVAVHSVSEGDRIVMKVALFSEKDRKSTRL